MIPKVIHYCWFGRGRKPTLANKCIASWRKYLPDYEIKEWNEDNFNINITPYVQEAYIAKKYAFVSDYARFWILYNYGGLYFDTDVELIKSIDNVIEKGNFLGVEDNGLDHSQRERKLKRGEYYVNPGLGIGAEPRLLFCKEMLESYENDHFILSNGKINMYNVVGRTTDILISHGLKITNQIQTIDGINIYPKEWFCPIRITDGKLHVTSNTVSVHHYAASWTSPMHRVLRKIILFLGGSKLKMQLSRLANIN